MIKKCAHEHMEKIPSWRSLLSASVSLLLGLLALYNLQ